eukprot:TRINITY_DN4926_c0_g1_i1.p1 TRINITY_DN4926_c0_g1~~TRINITY_DN4926_c0_g1_i1.p1  ORF type:complete len:624 (-),score=150.46 TRINITY_DN4926_c0_g1_i1:3-1649(-)
MEIEPALPQVAPVTTPMTATARTSLESVVPVHNDFAPSSAPTAPSLLVVAPAAKPLTAWAKLHRWFLDNFLDPSLTADALQSLQEQTKMSAEAIRKTIIVMKTQFAKTPNKLRADLQAIGVDMDPDMLEGVTAMWADEEPMRSTSITTKTPPALTPPPPPPPPAVAAAVTASDDSIFTKPARHQPKQKAAKPVLYGASASDRVQNWLVKNVELPYATDQNLQELAALAGCSAQTFRQQLNAWRHYFKTQPKKLRECLLSEGRNLSVDDVKALMDSWKPRRLAAADGNDGDESETPQPVDSKQKKRLRSHTPPRTPDAKVRSSKESKRKQGSKSDPSETSSKDAPAADVEARSAASLILSKAPFLAEWLSAHPRNPVMKASTRVKFARDYGISEARIKAYLQQLRDAIRRDPVVLLNMMKSCSKTMALAEVVAIVKQWPNIMTGIKPDPDSHDSQDSNSEADSDSDGDKSSDDDKKTAETAKAPANTVSSKQSATNKAATAKLKREKQRKLQALQQDEPVVDDLYSRDLRGVRVPRRPLTDRDLELAFG